MKRLSFFALGAVTLFTLSSAAPRTVKAPEFEMGSIVFRIAAVHLSDTATRVDADIYNIPNRWLIADTGIHLASRITDNVYPLLRIEGMPFGEKVFIGDSARIHSTFVFDPLAPADTVFDFADKKGSIFNIKGINLNYKPKGIRTNISGVIENRPDLSWLLLLPAGQNERTNKSIIVPVENGKFNYAIYTTDTLAFGESPGIERLNGYGTDYKFFAEGDSVKFNLSDPDRPFYFSISGGKNTTNLLNAHYQYSKPWKDSGLGEERNYLDSLKRYLSPEVYEIYDILDTKSPTQQQRDSLFNRINEIRNADEYYTTEGKLLNARSDSVFNLMDENKLAFIEKDGTLTGLYFIYLDMIYHGQDLEKELETFKRVYLPRYPKNPMSLELQLHLSNEKAEVGKHYPDFTAPDLRGNMHTLSDLIKDKYAVIDLWASWCGPCRNHSIDLIPVYEKWKDKGFTIVGIARETGDTRAMESCIKTDGYPWLNLVELNEAGNIWNRYLAGNMGGKVVFVSPTGEIIAINPSADEVDAQLTKLLGNEK
ncbi:MAG: TlpA family protein disulfide reductase [Paramuribaculum sp.]|nr:TlpA family protein disulfide reductase [Paramuribaculum sp.]